VKYYDWFCRNEGDGCKQMCSRKGGQCKQCADRQMTQTRWGHPKLPPPTCLDCGTRIRLRGTRCRACAMQTPARRAQTAAMRRHGPGASGRSPTALPSALPD